MKNWIQKIIFLTVSLLPAMGLAQVQDIEILNITSDWAFKKTQAEIRVVEGNLEYTMSVKMASTYNSLKTLSVDLHITSIRDLDINLKAESTIEVPKIFEGILLGRTMLSMDNAYYDRIWVRNDPIENQSPLMANNLELYGDNNKEAHEKLLEALPKNAAIELMADALSRINSGGPGFSTLALEQAVMDHFESLKTRPSWEKAHGFIEKVKDIGSHAIFNDPKVMERLKASTLFSCKALFL